jgi:hypothetical protein
LSHNSTEKDSYCAKELAEARFHASIIGWHGPFICPIRLNAHVWYGGAQPLNIVPFYPGILDAGELQGFSSPIP